MCLNRSQVEHVPKISTYCVTAYLFLRSWRLSLSRVGSDVRRMSRARHRGPAEYAVLHRGQMYASDQATKPGGPEPVRKMNDEHQRDNNVYGPSASPQLSACISAAWLGSATCSAIVKPLQPYCIHIGSLYNTALPVLRAEAGKAELPWHGTQPSEREEAFCGWKRGNPA